MRILIFACFMFTCLSGQAHAFAVSDTSAECQLNSMILPPSAKFTFSLDVQNDNGKPGLVYLAMVDSSRKNAYFFKASTVWEKYDGGLLPIFLIDRDGLQNMRISINLGGSYYFHAGSTLYVGYGLYEPGMEDKVQTRREALKKAKEDFPNRRFYDPGDDYMRRSLIEKDLRDVERYKPVMQINCPNVGFGMPATTPMIYQ